MYISPRANYRPTNFLWLTDQASSKRKVWAVDSTRGLFAMLGNLWTASFMHIYMYIYVDSMHTCVHIRSGGIRRLSNLRALNGQTSHVS